MTMKTIKPRVVRDNGRHYRSLSCLQEEYKRRYLDKERDQEIYGIIIKPLVIKNLVCIESGTIVKFEKPLDSNIFLLSGRFKHLFIWFSHRTINQLSEELCKDNFPKTDEERAMWKMCYHVDFKNP